MSSAKTAYDYFVSEGLSPAAATGVVGNLIAESGLNTTIRGDGGRAVGIAQWHPDRWGVLTSWAARSGLDPYALDTQLRFARREAATAAGGNVWPRLLGVSDAVTASALWMRLFERPADQSDANARRRAQKGIDALKGAGGTAGSGSGAGGAGGAGVGDALFGLDNPLGQLDPRTWAKALADKGRELGVEAAFVVLGVALVGAGLWRAVQPQLKARVDRATDVLL